MMKSKFLAWGGMLFALCAMLTVTSCSKDDDNGGGGGNVPPIPSNGVTSAAFSGFVTDGYVTMPGVTVTSGDQTVKTDFTGAYKLDKVKVVNGRALLKFEKVGFMSVVRSVPVEKAARLDVALVGCQKATFFSNAAKTIQVIGGDAVMEVSFPADAFVKEDGTPYSGAVETQAVYVSPDDENFTDQMPGDLTALRTDNSEAQLVSYGMVAVDLTGAGGIKLKLSPDKKATVKFPVPYRFKETTLPPSIPLWSFNEETGLWVEEGVANLSSDNEFYVGEVSHFSWHNLDYPQLRATLKVKVVDSQGNALPDVLVSIDGQRYGRTGIDGITSCTVPSNTPMVIWIPSDAYGNYAESLDNGYMIYSEDKIIRQENVTLAPQETKTITLTMPVKLPIIKGKVTNEGSGAKQCVVWITYGFDGKTNQVFSDAEGNFSFLLPDYSGPATFVAQYGDAYKYTEEITLEGKDIVLNVTVNTNAQNDPFVLRAIGSGYNMRYSLPAANDVCWKAVEYTPGVQGLTLHVHKQSVSSWGGVDLEIPDYNGEATFTTNQGSFSYMMEEMGYGGWTQVRSESATPITVTKNGDNFTFKIVNADASLTDQSLGMNWDNQALVKISVEFTAQISSGQDQVQ